MKSHRVRLDTSKKKNKEVLAYSVRSTPRSRIKVSKDSGIRIGNKNAPKIHFKYSHSRMAPKKRTQRLLEQLRKRDGNTTGLFGYL